MINTRLEQSEGGKFTTSNDFRQIGVVEVQFLQNGTHRFVGTAGTQAITIRIGTINGSNFIAIILLLVHLQELKQKLLMLQM